MTILILGANGQVGRALSQRLAGLGKVVALDRQRADLSRPESLPAIFNAHNPEWIINAAAYTAVDNAERESEQAFIINAQAPKIMAEWAAAHDAKFVHYSSDYVFDGRQTRPYLEADATAPLNAYGASKRAGELAIAAVSGLQAWIFRSSWVFSTQGDNFLKTILTLAQTRDSLSIVNDQFGAPTSAALIADVTARLIERAPQCPEPGIYHLAAAGETHWQAYAQFVIMSARAQGVSTRVMPEQVLGMSACNYPMPAARPMNSRLNCDKLQQAFALTLPDWRDDVRAVISAM